MTLTAITKDLQLFNPSVEIDSGGDRQDVVQKMRYLQRSGGLFCPHCYDRLDKLIPVRYRNAEARRVHFYHPKYEQEQAECKNHSGESEKHKAAKVAIELFLKTKGFGNTSLEQRLLISFGLVKHRQPDIVVTYPNGAIEAHEVQISPITKEELMQRTQDLKANKVGKVVWYLYGDAYNKQNRAWLGDNNIDHYRLWFKDSNIDQPRWEKAGKLDRSDMPQPSSSPIDQCQNTKNRSQNKQVPPSGRSDEKKELVKVPLVSLQVWRDVYKGRYFKYTGNSKSLQKQFQDKTLRVLSDDGAFATCIDDSSGVMYAWVPIFNCKEVGKPSEYWTSA